MYEYEILSSDRWLRFVASSHASVSDSADRYIVGARERNVSFTFIVFDLRGEVRGPRGLKRVSG